MAAARSSKRRFWTGWLAAAGIGFAAGTATAWAMGTGAGASPGPATVAFDFPHRQIAQSEWLRASPAASGLETMIRSRRPR